MFRQLMHFVRNIFNERLDHDLDEEIRSYLELVSAEKVLCGMSAEDAAREARRELKRVEEVKENVRDIRIGGSVDGLMQDLRYAVRMLRKNAGFTIAAVLMLAGGIGANTAMFSIVHNVLLRPPPFQEPGAAFGCFGRYSIHWLDGWAVSGPDFADYHEQNRSFEQISAIIPYFTETFKSREGPVVVHCAGASPEFFPALGLKPLLGRLYEPREYHADEASVVISYRFWQREFGGEPYPRFRFHEMEKQQVSHRDWQIETARDSAPGAGPNASVKLVPLNEYLVGSVEKPFRLLMAAVVL